MTPETAIASLDKQLAAHGEDVQLQYVSGPNATPVNVTVRAMIRSLKPEALVGDLTLQDVTFIISPTPLNAADWPTGITPPAGTDKRIPRKGFARLATSSGVLAVQTARGKYMNGTTLVRIDGVARGTP